MIKWRRERGWAMNTTEIIVNFHDAKAGSLPSQQRALWKRVLLEAAESRIGAMQHIELDLPKVFDNDQVWAWFLTAERQTCGIVYCENRNGVLLIHEPILRPAFHGRGVEEVVLRTLLGYLHEVGGRIATVVHPSNVDALKLYNKLGFEIVGKDPNFFGDGQPRLIVEWQNRIVIKRQAGTG